MPNADFEFDDESRLNPSKSAVSTSSADGRSAPELGGVLFGIRYDLQTTIFKGVGFCREAMRRRRRLQGLEVDWLFQMTVRDSRWYSTRHISMPSYGDFRKDGPCDCDPA